MNRIQELEDALAELKKERDAVYDRISGLEQHVADLEEEIDDAEARLREEKRNRGMELDAMKDALDDSEG